MARNKRRTNEQRRKISQGVKKFWDKKGRKKAALAIGTVIAGGGALALAAKRGKKVSYPANPNAGSAMTTSKLSGKDFFKGVAGTVEGTPMSKAIVPYRAGNSSLTTGGANPFNGALQSLKTEMPRNAGRSFAAIRSIPSSIRQGFNSGVPGDIDYETGKQAFKIYSNLKNKAKQLRNRRRSS